MSNFRNRLRSLFIIVPLAAVTLSLTACDPPIIPVPGAQPPGHAHSSLTADPSTLPPPPPPPITGNKS